MHYRKLHVIQRFPEGYLVVVRRLDVDCSLHRAGVPVNIAQGFGLQRRIPNEPYGNLPFFEVETLLPELELLSNEGLGPGLALIRGKDIRMW